MKRVDEQRGSILVTILTMMIFLSLTIMGLAVLVNSNVTRSRGRILQLQAQYAAESGADTAIAYLNSDPSASYTGTATDVTVLTATTYKATFSVSVASGNTSKQRIITATGKVYSPKSSATPTYIRKIRVTAARSTTTTASSLVSRNILALASSVKSVVAKDIYVNGFISMAKNVNKLTAENITVAGKDTGANNCSIEGAGSLVKPTTFSNPGQTKVNITTAYNNCVSPPGNVSNTDFNVTANTGNISTISSLYIPWSQYLDSAYTAAGSCSDWTSGASPRTIPSVAGSKKTHYPDSSSNVASSCGTNGDLALGSNQYNITDNVHIRANLCAASACDPTFYNPTSNMYFVFVEGTVNFGSVQTVAGSGPITFVVYGADPASKASACPYGGAFYLGQHGSMTTSAPALYVLAQNGACLDGTKFNGYPSFGGIGAKNIYIASQSGNPFDLGLDPNFPVSQIPVDLAWREVGYERL
jgi:Tfp pilus assembly protein PilX